MRIPITMAHGIPNTVKDPERFSPEELAAHFDTLIAIAREMGFESINYDQLAAWREGGSELPDRPIMFDFDHPARTTRYAVHELLDRYGYRGNLFINTGWLEGPPEERPPIPEEGAMTWDEIGELAELGWHIGAHTVTHPNISELSQRDPDGQIFAQELDDCNAMLERRLGIMPKDFAFTGTTWSSVAEREVMKRYRFGRLWIIGTEYNVDGQTMRYAELVGVDGPDEPDGGPPGAARYITRDSNPYRLPSMEIGHLIYEPEAFRAYLRGALETP